MLSYRDGLAVAILGQGELAEKIGVSCKAVSKWENDLTEPDTANLIKLSKIFDVSVEYLANGDMTEPITREYIEGTGGPVIDIRNNQVASLETYTEAE